MQFTGMIKDDELRIVIFLVCVLPMCVNLPLLNWYLLSTCQYDATGLEPPSGICYVVDGEADKLQLMKTDSWIVGWVPFIVKKFLGFVMPLSYMLAFFNSGAALVTSRITGNHRQSEMLVVDFFDICLYATSPWYLKGYLFLLDGGVRKYWEFCYLFSLFLVFSIEAIAASLVYGCRLLPGSCITSWSAYSRRHRMPPSVAKNTLPKTQPDPRLISGLSLVLNAFILVFRSRRVFFFWYGTSIELLLLIKNLICILYDIALILSVDKSTKQCSQGFRAYLLDLIIDVLPSIGSLSRETATELLKGKRLTLEDKRFGARLLREKVKKDWETIFFEEAMVEVEAAMIKSSVTTNYHELHHEGAEQAEPLTTVSNSLRDVLYYFAESDGKILDSQKLLLNTTDAKDLQKLFARDAQGNHFPNTIPTNFEQIANAYLNPTRHM